MPAFAAHAGGAEGDVGGEPLLLAHRVPTSPNPGMAPSVPWRKGVWGHGSEAQGPQRGMGGSGRGGQGSGRGQEARWGPRGCAAGRIPVPSFPPLFTGCKVPGIPLRGGPAVRTHFAKVTRAAGGARQPRGRRERGGDRGRVAQLLSPQATQMCSVGTPRMSVQGRGGMGSKPGLPGPGRGLPGPFEAPIKGSSIKGGESQRNKESG